MKITYRVKKVDLNKVQPLAGIRKSDQPTQEQVEKVKIEKLKRFDPTRVILTSILLFLIEILVLYLVNFPIVKWSIDYLKSPVTQLPVISYNTIRLSLGNELPDATKKEVMAKLSGLSFEGKNRFEFVSENPDVTLTYTAEKPTDAENLGENYIVPVGHMYWIRDTVAKGNLQQDEILVPTGMKALFDKVIGKYSEKAPKTKEVSDLLASLKSQEKSVGFAAVTTLNGQYKLLSLDGKYFFENAPSGGLAYYLTLQGSSEAAKNIIKIRADTAFPDSFAKESLLSVRMTGVTAITRSLGIKSNASGDPAYAARKIGDFLKAADLTHVSNEISMMPGCAPAGGVSFCMVPNQIAALKASGVDIVELTGNHNNDKGSIYNTSTIKTYNALGWSHFGGGLDSTDSAKILYKDVKGTKVAFLGYNYYDSTVGSPGALASKTHAGANAWSNAKVKKDVTEARKNADVVIVDFQYQECWSYTDNGSTVQSCYGPIVGQARDFRYAIDAGADIVIGTQAHQPQTYEIYKGKVIYYGLGNLFFDQTEQLGTRQGLILTHYMYKGKYLGTGITTTIFDSNLLTYITTGTQRTSFLKSLQVWRPKN